MSNSPMSGLRLAMQEDASMSVFGQPRTLREVYVLLGLNSWQRRIPKDAGFWFEPERKIWWTAEEAKARQLSQYADSQLRQRWQLELADVNHGELAVIGTEQQDACWREVIDGEGHIILIALAGCGKSFTIIHAARLAIERQPLLRIVFAAFNRKIADELKPKIPIGTRAETLNALGNAAIRNAVAPAKIVIDEDGKKVAGLAREVALQKWNMKASSRMISFVAALVGHCKGYLLDGTPADLEFIAQRHDIEVAPGPKELSQLMDGDPPPGMSYVEWQSEIAAKYRAQVFEVVPRVLELGTQDLTVIDLNDQLYLPVKLKLGVEQADLLLIDEGQDMNPCQRAFCLMMCPHGRLMVVGDPNQAIYGFRGSDSRSLEMMEALLRESKSNSRPVVKLPLTRSFRCGRVIVEEARRIVPEFEAMPDALEGEISTVKIEAVAKLAKPGHMILCRTSAPLVKMAHELIRAGKRPALNGDAFFKRVVALVARMDMDAGLRWQEEIDKLDAGTFDDNAENIHAGFDKRGEVFPPELSRMILVHRDAETQRLALAGKSGNVITAMQDECDTVLTLLEGCASRAQFKRRLDAVFDDSAAGEDSITLSTVHSSKGLEADTVIVLHPYLMPHPNAQREEDLQQEENLKYVAVTRAKKRLIWAVDEAEAKKRGWRAERSSEAEKSHKQASPPPNSATHATPCPEPFSPTEAPPLPEPMPEPLACDPGAVATASHGVAALPVESETLTFSIPLGGRRAKTKALLIAARQHAPFDDWELADQIQLLIDLI